MTTRNFTEQLQTYADLAIKIGLNIQPGDLMTLSIDVEQAPFAHLLVAAAYRAGARNVIMQWQDAQIQRLAVQAQSDDELSSVLPHQETLSEYIATQRIKRLVVMSSDPDTLAGLPADKIAAFQRRDSQGIQAVRSATQSNRLSWLIIGAASPAWAQKVFPGETAEVATDHLWQAIFKTMRLDSADPIKAWEDHRQKLSAKAEMLNAQQFDRLHYTAPGTDLVIGLPQDHRWEAAGATNEKGDFFIPNMPTEEVFTAPDANRVDGTVSSTKPLSYAGTILSGLHFTFAHGKVIAATAAQGQATLDHLLATDDGARHLGEVALVPDQSPISQSGITYFNTLFDENASDHLALGAAYPFSIKNGTNMTKLALQKAGLNSSQIHVDFMVGSAEMNIDGITKSGAVVPLFRQGNWVE
ncbi:aminopeptidase [Lapidilactobacillus achengensis]|uniref:Aminopeptidase n=1 Tax=Lapidilactobacillus achengensis TaxID=2486000 RepID=A0ABW1UK17_9LACO|nr:aminopeptidase [Lapidilactobacillus achengensis]